MLVKPLSFPDSIEAFLSIPANHPDRRKVKAEKYAGSNGKQLFLPPPTKQDLGLSDSKTVFHSTYQVFTLGLLDVANNRGVQAAKPAGWIFFAGNENKTVIGRLSHRAPSRMTAVYHDPRASVLLKQSLALESLEPGGQYEPRLLTVPGLNLLVFWLVALNATPSDLVVPYPNQHIGTLNLSDARFFPIARFFELIRPLALRRWSGTPSHVG